MKLRVGFVSNSSSSSFVIVAKKGQEITEESVHKAFKVEKNSIFYGMSIEMAKIFADRAEQISVKDFLNEFDEDSVQAFGKKNGFKLDGSETFYVGSVADDEDGIEACLCSLRLDYEDDEIIIKKEGGY